MPAIRPADVSRYLAERGHTRARGHHYGYHAVYGSQDGTVLVEYLLGTYGADLTDDQRRTRISARIHAMRRTLTARYAVTLHEPDTGWHPFWLLVTARDPLPEETLTPPQRRALRLIREGGVTYRYKPLTPSLNRPEPVTPADLRPRFNYGLQPRTVDVLERLGLVRLVPITPEHGKVVAIEGEQP